MINYFVNPHLWGRLIQFSQDPFPVGYYSAFTNIHPECNLF